jgi:hypothetical protein
MVRVVVGSLNHLLQMIRLGSVEKALGHGGGVGGPWDNNGIGAVGIAVVAGDWGVVKAVMTTATEVSLSPGSLEMATAGGGVQRSETKTGSSQL